MTNSDAELRNAVELVAARSGWVAGAEWVEKTMDIYRTAQIHRGILLMGPSGSGKSSCVAALIGALSWLADGQHGQESGSSTSSASGRSSMADSELGATFRDADDAAAGYLAANTAAAGGGPHGSSTGQSRRQQHRVHRLYPGAVREEYLYGYYRLDGEWVEGIIPGIVRQALQGAGGSTMHWIVLDGPFAKAWTHHLRQALTLTGPGCLCLGNGDQLFLPNNVRFIFESTPEQANAVSMLSSHLGTVHIGEDCLPWQAIVTPWLRSRRSPEAAILDPLFGRYIEPSLDLVMGDSVQACLEVPRCGRLKTMLTMLTSLLAESVSTATILSPVHLECNFLFCLAWSLGGPLDENSRRVFHDLLCGMTSLIPSEHSGMTIFDYCITPTADWEPWAEIAADQEQDLASGIVVGRDQRMGRFVHTAETVCASFLLQVVGSGGGHAMIVGPHGAGRSTLVQQVSKQQRHLKAVRRLAVTGATPARLLQRFVTRHTTRRTGHVYGAEGGKPLLLLLDDIDACNEDLFVTQQATAVYLQRQAAEAGGRGINPLGLHAAEDLYNDAACGSLHGKNKALAADHTHPHEVMRLLLEEGQWFPADGEAERRSHTMHDILRTRDTGRAASLADGGLGAAYGLGAPGFLSSTSTAGGNRLPATAAGSANGSKTAAGPTGLNASLGGSGPAGAPLAFRGDGVSSLASGGTPLSSTGNLATQNLGLTAVTDISNALLDSKAFTDDDSRLGHAGINAGALASGFGAGAGAGSALGLTPGQATSEFLSHGSSGRSADMAGRNYGETSGGFSSTGVLSFDEEESATETAVLDELQEPHWITDLQVIATAQPSHGRTTSLQRVARHFAVFYLQAPGPDTSQSILSVQMTLGLPVPGSMGASSGLSIATHNEPEVDLPLSLPDDYFRRIMAAEALVEMTRQAVDHVNRLIRPNMWSGYQCAVGGKETHAVLRGCRRFDLARSDESLMGALWRQECLRVLGDRLMRRHDLLQLEVVLISLLNSRADIFGRWAFPLDVLAAMNAISILGCDEAMLVASGLASSTGSGVAHPMHPSTGNNNSGHSMSSVPPPSPNALSVSAGLGNSANGSSGAQANLGASHMSQSNSNIAAGNSNSNSSGSMAATIGSSGTGVGTGNNAAVANGTTSSGSVRRRGSTPSSGANPSVSSTAANNMHNAGWAGSAAATSSFLKLSDAQMAASTKLSLLTHEWFTFDTVCGALLHVQQCQRALAPFGLTMMDVYMRLASLDAAAALATSPLLTVRAKALCDELYTALRPSLPWLSYKSLLAELRSVADAEGRLDFRAACHLQLLASESTLRSDDEGATADGSGDTETKPAEFSTGSNPAANDSDDRNNAYSDASKDMDGHAAAKDQQSKIHRNGSDLHHATGTESNGEISGAQQPTSTGLNRSSIAAEVSRKSLAVGLPASSRNEVLSAACSPRFVDFVDSLDAISFFQSPPLRPRLENMRAAAGLCVPCPKVLTMALLRLYAGVSGRHSASVLTAYGGSGAVMTSLNFGPGANLGPSSQTTSIETKVDVVDPHEKSGSVSAAASPAASHNAAGSSMLNGGAGASSTGQAANSYGLAPNSDGLHGAHDSSSNGMPFARPDVHQRAASLNEASRSATTAATFVEPLTPSIAELVTRMTRLFNLDNGHGIFVGPASCGIDRAYGLAAELAGCVVQDVMGNSVRTFNRDMRTVYRLGGSKNQSVCAVVDGEQLSLSVMERLHSFVATGEVFDLFAAEEEQALFEGVEEDLARDSTPGLSAQAFFQRRLQRNIHLILVFRSWNDRLQLLAQHFPAMLSQCYLCHQPNLTLQNCEQYAAAALLADPTFREFSLAAVLKLARAIAAMNVAGTEVDVRSVTQLTQGLKHAESLAAVLDSVSTGAMINGIAANGLVNSSMAVAAGAGINANSAASLLNSAAAALAAAAQSGNTASTAGAGTVAGVLSANNPANQAAAAAAAAVVAAASLHTGPGGAWGANMGPAMTSSTAAGPGGTASTSYNGTGLVAPPSTLLTGAAGTSVAGPTSLGNPADVAAGTLNGAPNRHHATGSRRTMTGTGSAQRTAEDEDLSFCRLQRLTSTFAVVFREKRHQQLQRQVQLEQVLQTCYETDAHIAALREAVQTNAEQMRELNTNLNQALDRLTAEAAHEINNMVDGGCESDDDEELLAVFVNEKRHAQRQRAAQRNEQINIVSPQSHVQSLQLEAALRQVETWQSKLTLKRIDTLRSLSNPPLLVQLVCDMLMVALRRSLDGDAAQRRSQTRTCSNWSFTLTQLQDPTVADQIQRFDVHCLDDERVELLDVYLALPEMSTHRIRRASKDAYVVLEWIYHMLDYHRVLNEASGRSQRYSSPFVGGVVPRLSRTATSLSQGHDRGSSSGKQQALEPLAEDEADDEDTQNHTAAPPRRPAVLVEEADDDDNVNDDDDHHDNDEEEEDEEDEEDEGDEEEEDDREDANGNWQENDDGDFATGQGQDGASRDRRRQQQRRGQRRRQQRRRSKALDRLAVLENTSGMDVVASSSNVKELQQQYDELLAKKQACEAQGQELDRRLKAAYKRQSSFENHVAQWSAQLHTLQRGRWLCGRNSLLVATAVTFGGNCSDTQRNALKLHLLRKSADVFTPAALVIPVPGAAVDTRGPPLTFAGYLQESQPPTSMRDTIHSGGGRPQSAGRSVGTGGFARSPTQRRRSPVPIARSPAGTRSRRGSGVLGPGSGDGWEGSGAGGALAESPAFGSTVAAGSGPEIAGAARSASPELPWDPMEESLLEAPLVFRDQTLAEFMDPDEEEECAVPLEETFALSSETKSMVRLALESVGNQSCPLFYDPASLLVNWLAEEMSSSSFGATNTATTTAAATAAAGPAHFGSDNNRPGQSGLTNSSLSAITVVANGGLPKDTERVDWMGESHGASAGAVLSNGSSGTQNTYQLPMPNPRGQQHYTGHATSNAVPGNGFSRLRPGQIRVCNYESRHLRAELKACLTSGFTLVVAGVSSRLWFDDRLVDVLHRRQCLTSQGHVAVSVAGEIVDWHPQFRLILLTRTPMSPPSVLAARMWTMSLAPGLRAFRLCAFARVARERQPGLYGSLRQTLALLATEQQDAHRLRNRLLRLLSQAQRDKRPVHRSPLHNQGGGTAAPPLGVVQGPESTVNGEATTVRPHGRDQTGSDTHLDSGSLVGGGDPLQLAAGASAASLTTNLNIRGTGDNERHTGANKNLQLGLNASVGGRQITHMEALLSAVGQDVTWADTIVDTQHRFDLAVGRVQQTQREVLALAGSMDLSESAANAVASLMYMVSLLPVFAAQQLVTEPLIDCLDQALRSTLSELTFSAGLLCRQFVTLTLSRFSPGLAEPHRAALEMLLALQIQSAAEDASAAASAAVAAGGGPAAAGQSASSSTQLHNTAAPTNAASSAAGHATGAAGPSTNTGPTANGSTSHAAQPPFSSASTSAPAAASSTSANAATASTAAKEAGSKAAVGAGNARTSLMRGTGTTSGRGSSGTSHHGVAGRAGTSTSRTSARPAAGERTASGTAPAAQGSAHQDVSLNNLNDSNHLTARGSASGFAVAESVLQGSLLLAREKLNLTLMTAQEPLWQWVRRPDPHVLPDWPALDLGQNTDNKGLVMPLADLKLKNAQLETKIAALQQRVAAIPWLSPLAHVVDTLARHRSEWMAWRESLTPEVMTMPASQELGAAPELALMLGGSLRPDRFQQLSERYISTKLPGVGHERTTSWWQALQLLEGLSNTQALLLLRQDGQATVASAATLRQWAKNRGQETACMSLSMGVRLPELRRLLLTCMAKGVWLVLTQVQGQPRLALDCVALIQSLGKEQRHEHFRLILVHSGEGELPETLLTACRVAYVGGAGSFRAEFAQLLLQVPPETVACSNRADWIPLLHNLCYLHAVLNARGRFGLAGWSGLYHFGSDTLRQIINYARLQYENSDAASQRLTAVRFYVELVYGSIMTSARDRKLLATFASLWISSAACKPDFEFYHRPALSMNDSSSRSYKLPALAVSNKGRSTRGALLQELAATINASPELDEVALPWICHLPSHASPSHGVGSLWLREVLRQLVPVLDFSGQSCMPMVGASLPVSAGAPTAVAAASAFAVSGLPPGGVSMGGITSNSGTTIGSSNNNNSNTNNNPMSLAFGSGSSVLPVSLLDVALSMIAGNHGNNSSSYNVAGAGLGSQNQNHTGVPARSPSARVGRLSNPNLAASSLTNGAGTTAGSSGTTAAGGAATGVAGASASNGVGPSSNGVAMGAAAGSSVNGAAASTTTSTYQQPPHTPVHPDNRVGAGASRRGAANANAAAAGGAVRRSSRGRISQRPDKQRAQVPCPAHRPLEIHRLLWSLPTINIMGKQKRRWDSNTTSASFQRFLTQQVNLMRLSLRHLAADLRELDEICAGRRSPSPEASEMLTLIEQGRTPAMWKVVLYGPQKSLNSGPVNLNLWLDALQSQAREVERAATMGLKTPSFGLGVFPAPRSLLTALRIMAVAASGNDDMVFYAEVTAREREHLREAPLEGVFLHGLILHGAQWEAPPGEAREVSRYVETGLPVIHVHFGSPRVEDESKAAKARLRNELDAKKKGSYRCPVFLNVHDQPGDNSMLFMVNLPCDTPDTAQNFSFKGVHCSMRQ